MQRSCSCKTNRACDHYNLTITNPDLCKEWDDENNKLTPEEVTCKSGRKAWWICPKNPCGCHNWEACISSRTGKKPSGCPYCSGRLACKHDNLLVKYPKLCEEWDYQQNAKDPAEYKHGSHDKVWWICKTNKCGCHKWEATIYSRVSGNGCMHCLGRKTCEHYNLMATHPELCKEWNYEKNDKPPEEHSAGMDAKVWWTCVKNPCGCHVWDASIFHRSRTNGKATGCPFCANLKLCDHNNLLAKYPKICEEWDYDKNDFSPNKYPPNSNKSAWWKCETSPCECHEWKAVINDRTGLSMHNCPFCSRNKTCKHTNLLVLRPELCKEWDYKKNDKGPDKYALNSNLKAWWICAEKHSWRTVISDRTKVNGYGCPVCSPKGYSKKQLKWLEQISTKYNIDIQHVKNGGEHSIKNNNGGYYRLDGFFELNGKKYALEFHGDFWHGCELCYDQDEMNTVVKKTFGELNRRTLQKRKFLEENGYTVISIRECEFDDNYECSYIF